MGEIEMKENEKIRLLIKEHEAIFKATDFDVAESTKGHWMFFRYNEENGYYDTLAPFTTAKELAEIIVGEMALDVFSTIDCEPEYQPDIKNFIDDVDMVDSYKPHIKRLMEYLN